MLTVAEAKSAIASAMPEFDSVTVDLGSAGGRMLRQAITAERDQPPFDRVTMDGIAIRHATLAAGTRQFRIEGTQHAGDEPLALEVDDGCVEIMTGAMLPAGADCIVPVERISVDAGVATIEKDYAAERRQFIHPQASDYAKGHEVLQPGIRLGPAEIAIVASCGLDKVAVDAQPPIRVVSTGNELVPPGEPIAAHQVRLSNGPAIVAMLAQHGYTDAAHEHIVDEPALLESRLGALLDESRVMILSGGVSMGKADFVPDVLQSLGVEVVFHRISQRPGKPMWFGIGPAGQAIFALPGNPVSTLVCCRHYVLPALQCAAGGGEKPAGAAVLHEDVTFRPDLTCFLPVRLLTGDGGEIRAIPVATNTSGDFAALGGTDGYVELEKEQSEFPAGTVVPLHRWRLA